MKKLLLLTLVLSVGQVWASEGEKRKHAIANLVMQLETMELSDAEKKDKITRLSRLAQEEWGETGIYPNVRWDYIYPTMSRTSEIIKPYFDLLNSISTGTLEDIEKTLQGNSRQWVNVINVTKPSYTGIPLTLAIELLWHQERYVMVQDVLALLLKNGADINARDEIGRTVLIFNVVHKQPDLILFLLENGANASLRDYSGKTALDYARKYHLDEIIKIFENWSHHEKDRSLTIQEYLPVQDVSYLVEEYLGMPSKEQKAIAAQEEEETTTDVQDTQASTPAIESKQIAADTALLDNIETAFTRGHLQELKKQLNIAEFQKKMSLVAQLYHSKLKLKTPKKNPHEIEKLMGQYIDVNAAPVETTMPEVE
jgi:hypothetical protein